MATDPTAPDGDVPSRFQVDFVGRTLAGQYRVDRRLAEGGMGSVYVAEDGNLGMRVVVKVPHARFLGEPGFRTRFRREIAELVRLEHPHVVRILARGEEDEVPYFVLQFLGGGSLEDRLKEGRETPRRALSWLLPIAQTLDFVHGRGVVHRDVKPANILFDERGHVFLSDFGVVKALAGDEGEKTEVGTGVGSPFYMAPEQAIGREVTGAADQYALAATLYEALSGEPPFGKGTVVEVTIRKQQGTAEALSSHVPDLPAACDAAVARALSSDPAQRFPTCEAFAQAFAAGFAPAELAPRGRLRRWTPFAVAALLLLGVGAGFFLGWFHRGAEAESDPVREIIQLGNAGAEPRRPYRYQLVPGTTDHFTFKNGKRIVFPIGGGKKKVVRSIDTAEVDEKVEGGRPAEVAWTLHVPKELPGEEIDEDDRATAQRDLDSIGDARFTSTVGSRGSVLSVEFHPDHPLTPMQNGIIDSNKESLYSVGVVLPEEPIGVGAEWDVTQGGRIMGLRTQMTTTYRLVEATGDRLRFELTFQQSMAPQEFTPPGTKVKLSVKAMTGRGTGAEVVDLAKAAPVSFRMKSDFTMTMTYPGLDQPLDVEGTVEGELARE